ncbi:MAG: hypothetical protein ACN6O1_07670 [Comamonas sp.]|uniref:hypothetical protein n=1 Tax=Comamonas sp. TaxID=34028 RepID=UPI003D0F5E14
MLKNPCLGGNKYKDFLIKANIFLPPGGYLHGVHAWSRLVPPDAAKLAGAPTSLYAMPIDQASTVAVKLCRTGFYHLLFLISH